jgi:signal transduction histidine kinase
MSSLAHVVSLPVRQDLERHDPLEHDIVLALATAEDLASAMTQVVASIRRSSGAARVEWWAEGKDGELQLGAALGIARGSRHELPLERTGALVLHGGSVEPALASAWAIAAPIIRRRAAEERLARTAIELARHNEALEDFAALVAHELKTPLHAALLADDPSRHLDQALDLVDALLEAARSAPPGTAFVSAKECVDQVIDDLGAEVEVTTDLQAMLPLPSGPLIVLLRNLLSNAVAAGARHVHVAAVRRSCSLRLHVDDDGVGLAHADRYAAGSGLGLSLSRRIAGRFGGVLELTPRPSGGTRATVEFAEVPS